MADWFETYLTTGEAARRLQVDRKTVTRWCAAGLLRTAWKTPGERGRWRVSKSEVDYILHAWELHILPRPADGPQTHEEG
jgi:excisionase family DNA binding protein